MNGTLKIVIAFLLSVIIIPIILILNPKEKKAEKVKEITVKSSESKKMEIEESRDKFQEIKINNNGNLDLKINKVNTGDAVALKLEKYEDCSESFVFHSRSTCKGN